MFDNPRKWKSTIWKIVLNKKNKNVHHENKQFESNRISFPFSLEQSHVPAMAFFTDLAEQVSRIEKPNSSKFFQSGETDSDSVDVDDLDIHSNPELEGYQEDDEFANTEDEEYANTEDDEYMDDEDGEELELAEHSDDSDNHLGGSRLKVKIDLT